MKMKQLKQGKRHLRKANGAALIGGTAMMTMITLIVVGMLLLILNTGVLGNNNSRLQSIASDAARQISSKRWWLGMERKEWVSDESFRKQAKEEAELAVTAALAELGMPAPSNFEVKYQKGTVRSVPITLVEVSFDVSNVRICSAGFLPALIPMHVSAVSSDSEQAIEKHGMALLLFVDPANPGVKRGIRVPIYNATNGHSQSMDPGLIRAGVSTGNYVEAYLRLNCRNSARIGLAQAGPASHSLKRNTTVTNSL